MVSEITVISPLSGISPYREYPDRLPFNQPAAGTIHIWWAPGHGIGDQASPPNSFITESNKANWTYELLDSVPPQLASRLPNESRIRKFSEVEVWFERSEQRSLKFATTRHRDAEALLAPA